MKKVMAAVIASAALLSGIGVAATDHAGATEAGRCVICR